MNFLRLFLTFISFSILQGITAQERKCSSTEHHHHLMENPEYAENFRVRMAAFNRLSRTKTAESRMACTNRVTIPVAIHFQGISSSNRSCLENLVNEQIATLNADFQGTNPDIGSWANDAASLFPGVSNGETCIEFCVATRNHPNGYNLVDGQMAITINQTNGDRVNNWAGYLNIFVFDVGNNILGYAPLGGRGNGDGVVIAKFAFGGTGACGDVSTSSSLDRGRTLTHEVGHYFLLNHIWGDGGCNADDGVADTPNSNQPNYGCPQNGKVGCNSIDMHMNYMDYTNDECMYMFSAGQSTRMENYVQANLQSLINNAVNACGPAPEPTCTDGIQNGNETGVDCGGDCSPCPEPTCEDGVQNGNETGIDCGGDCSPCPTTPTCGDGIQNGSETGVDCGGPDCADCPTNCNQNLVYVLVRPDNYGSEITWVIQDENGTEVANGGPYSDFNTQVQQTEICLPAGCYSFTIFDAFADGICCEYGNGEYGIFDLNGNPLALGNGQYTTSDTKSISVGGNNCGSTPPPPPPADVCTAAEPTTLEYFNNITRVRINWEPVPDATRYQIQYREEGFTGWTRVTTSRTRRTLRNLFPSTTYQVRFRSRCPDGWTDYGPTYTFNTLSGRFSPEVEEQVLTDHEPIVFNKMYPNPTTDGMTLDYELDIDGEVIIRVFDMLGRRVVNRVENQEEGQQKIWLPTADLQNGTYILQVTMEDQQIVKKFVKH
ncbi:MAG: T9SS type A sorting domain-containing protein [Bacteroidota bacterium]